ncbi:hypothetical protein Mapa_006816 [Marchantia paleacea]|nr:hypothetical protein Mapa_006816 [Marchantia paleacea]
MISGYLQREDDIYMNFEEALRVELCTLSSRSCVTPTEEAFTFCIVSKAYSSGLTCAWNQQRLHWLFFLLWCNSIILQSNSVVHMSDDGPRI